MRSAWRIMLDQQCASPASSLLHTTKGYHDCIFKACHHTQQPDLLLVDDLHLKLEGTRSLIFQGEAPEPISTQFKGTSAVAELLAIAI